MKEVIMRLTSDHIKVKGAEYVCDLVRCRDCNKTEKRTTELDGHKYCSILTGWVDDNFYCGYGEVRDEYERAVEQMEYDMLYEPTYNPEDGSM